MRFRNWLSPRLTRERSRVRNPAKPTLLQLIVKDILLLFFSSSLFKPSTFNHCNSCISHSAACPKRNSTTGLHYLLISLKITISECRLMSSHRLQSSLPHKYKHTIIPNTAGCLTSALCKSGASRAGFRSVGVISLTRERCSKPGETY